MRRFSKAISYFLVLTFFAIALSGCGKTTTSTQKTITVWGFDTEDSWAQIKKDFEKANSGYTLNYQKQSLDSKYENRVLNSILSGSGPDVWAMPNDWVYRHKDKLAPRPADSKTALDMDKSFVPSVKQSVVFNNKIYALSPSDQPLIVYYNQKLLNTALDNYENANTGTANADKRKNAEKVLGNGVPTNWTDFTTAVQIITQKNGGTITLSGAALGTDNLTYSQDILYLLMLQNQTKILSDSMDQAVFNLPTTTPKDTSSTPGEKAMTFFASFANPGNPNYSWNNDMGNDIDAFATGKTAMIFGYDEVQNTLAQKYPDFQYKKGAVPQLTNDSTAFVDYAKFNAYGVNSLSQNVALSWGIVDSIASTYADDINSANRLYTATKSSSYDISLDNRSTSNPEKNSLASAQTLIKGRYPVEFDESFRNAIFAVNKGIQTPQKALDLIADSITTNYLRKQGW